MSNEIDLSALVDIISNIAGMMLLLACVALLVSQKEKDPVNDLEISTKPISFPMAYIPDKRSLTLCLKFGNLYELPEKELLEAIKKNTENGQAVQWLTVSKEGVNATIHLTPTNTGFRFEYKLTKDGGVPLNATQELVKRLGSIIEKYSPQDFFYVFHTWPQHFSDFREIREYLLENGVEIGWVPRTNEEKIFDVVYSMGEYDEHLSTIKAQ